MSTGTLFSCDTEYGHYEVADTIYSGRPARVLYSGAHQAAQSGLAMDCKPELLFDYNERFMELCRGLLPHKILLLGGGACTLPKALLEEFPDMKQDIVELDAKLLEIAQQYFDFKPSANTQLHVADIRQFLTANDDQYDLILLDVFTHAAIPRQAQTAELAVELAGHLTADGVAAMNVISGFAGRLAEPLQRQAAALTSAFNRVEVFPAGYGLSLWLSQNFIVTATQSGSTAHHMRYKEIGLPEISRTDLLHDD
jgi:spermidine synthase